ncbi:hypothetical protein [Paraburkholderia tropica]|uniref:hypothetical protein n=1 Tax=Paraburkholderia tropica TaxID=92647 RepID=UPI002AB6CF20|nr:hypothetical protein [Paraburkholderia tropica]
MATSTARLERALESAMQIVTDLTRLIAESRDADKPAATKPTSDVAIEVPQKRARLTGSTALEIGALVVEGKLKNLPKDRGGILKRATTEGWPFELRSGRGGQTKVFRIPAKYVV